MRENSLRLCLRAILFSIIVNGLELFALFRFEGYSLLLFSDWDESYYLRHALRLGRHLLAGTLQGSELLYPYDPFLMLIGAFSTLSGLKPVTLGLLADLLCCAGAYYALTRLYETVLGKSGCLNETAALITIMLPWLLSVSEMLDLRSSAFPHLAMAAHHFYPCPGVFRALSTQFGFLFFVVALRLYLQSSLSPGRDSHTLRASALAGAACAALIYIYIFAFGAAAVVIAILMLLEWPFSARPYKFLLKRQILFALVFALTCLPALFFMTIQKSVQMGSAAEHVATVQSLIHLERYWYLAPLDLVVLICVGVLLLREWVKRRRMQNSATPCVIPVGYLLFWAILCAKFLLMNLQPLVAARIEPYKFPLFYLDPLLTGLAILGLQIKFLREGSLSLLLSALIVLTGGLTVVRIASLKASDAQVTESFELFSFLAEGLPKNSMVAALPAPIASGQDDKFEFFLMPYWIEALTEQRSLALFWTPGLKDDEIVKRELVLRWLYTGELGLLRACPEKPPPFSPKNMLTTVTPYWEAHRVYQCRIYRTLSQHLTGCNILGLVQEVSYVLGESPAEPKTAGWLNEIWSSSNRTYRVFKLDQLQASRALCPESENAPAAGPHEG